MDNSLKKKIGFSFDKFGTRVNFVIIANDDQENDVGKLFSEIVEIYEKYDRIFNRFSRESEISKLNSGLGLFNVASDEMLQVVEKSIFYNEKTDGYFDPRIASFLEGAGYSEDFSTMPKKQDEKDEYHEDISSPLSEDLKIKEKKVFFAKKMDFSGLVKGVVNDLASEFFLKAGYNNHIVDSGGDIFFLGRDINNEKWTTEVEGISSEKLILHVSDEAMATSGIAKRKWDAGGSRKHHLINPKNTSEFNFDLKSVTVMESSTERADVWAKTLFLMGKEQGIEFSKNNNVKSVFLSYSGCAWISPEMKRYE